MKSSKHLCIGFAAVFMLISATSGFSQDQSAQNRIPQQIVVNGQHVNGAYVLAAGGMQSFTCSNPQQYVTPEGASQGWACYDQATGVWLLNAVPHAPAQAQAPLPVQPQQPVVIYQQTPPVVYQQQPTFIYQQPAYVYATAGYGYPMYIEPWYSPRMFLGASAFHATGRIVSAVFSGPRYYSTRAYYGGRHYRR